MTEQRTPDELSPQQQTELICKKLLGLQVLHLPYSGTQTCTTWCDEKYKRFDFIDKFETWAEAGLILDALARDKAYSAAVGFDPRSQHGDWCGAAGHHSAHAASGPLAIRTAALEYIRSLP
jgi:hypothetical protein